jgi:osmotically-inducible protein OsmY
MQQTKFINATIIVSSLLLTACEPVTILMGGTALVGGAATREKGLGGTASDTAISTEIQAKFYSYSQDMHAAIGVNAQSGEVLLTGSVKDAEWSTQGEKLSWEVKGVKQVFNHITVEDQASGVSDVAADSVITSTIKTHLLCDGNIHSLNFSVRTEKGIVYLMGIAQDQQELDKVLEYASTTKNVEKVVSYVKLKEETKAE